MSVIRFLEQEVVHGSPCSNTTVCIQGSDCVNDTCACPSYKTFNRELQHCVSNDKVLLGASCNTVHDCHIDDIHYINYGIIVLYVEVLCVL